ncbi:MAG: carbohydrate-binding family 9-like protein, partial [Acidobacteriota bacterium]
ASSLTATNNYAMTSKAASAKVHHLKNEIPIGELDNDAWRAAADVTVENYWSGEKAPAGRHVTAKLLWSETGLYVRFDASQSEPLVVSDKPDLTQKIRGLWDRDVCEIFVAPNASQRNKYFEFEIAPTGEWVDVGIEVAPDGRKSDWDYKSGMMSAVRVEKTRVVMAIKIPWTALGMRPKAGDVWLGNLLRCVGKDPTRGYLSWQATKTKEPAFHVPSAFGEFRFVK